MRASPKEPTIDSESSVQASPTTTISKSCSVCHRTVEIASLRTLLQLYVAIMTLMRGGAAGGFRTIRLRGHGRKMYFRLRSSMSWSCGFVRYSTEAEPSMVDLYMRYWAQRWELHIT